VRTGRDLPAVHVTAETMHDAYALDLGLGFLYKLCDVCVQYRLPRKRPRTVSALLKHRDGATARLAIGNRKNPVVARRATNCGRRTAA
jgi:hypothetical protein